MKDASIRSRTARRLKWLLILLPLGAGVWFFSPLQADLRQFDPVCVGEAEAVMWKHYYEPQHVWLAVDLYRVARRAYGLSPCDSLRITWHAARAASLFHGSSDGKRHAAAEQHLKGYYGVIASHLRGADAPEAAQLELRWWREHRARDYEACGKTLAALSAAVYGGGADRYAGAARHRVAAMMRCDRRQQQALGEKDWSAIRVLLTDSYGALKLAVNLPVP